MTPQLRKYLALERLMLILDEENDPSAEVLREAMDPLWYSLTDDERRLLNDRTIGRLTSLEQIRIPADSAVFGDAPHPTQGGRFPSGPIRGWTKAA